jgi:hypothetical protein
LEVNDGMTAKSRLDLYLRSQTAVKGWLDSYSAEVIAELGRVAAGAARFFLEPGTTARPFATSPNKMYIASPEDHESYRTALQASQSTHFYRTCSMFRYEVDMYEARGRGAGRHGIGGLGTALDFARRAKRYLGSLGS